MPKEYTYTLNDNVLTKLCDIATDGTKTITENGIGIDVKKYAAVDVNVPQGPTPTGKKDITSTTEVDVAAYATAQVVDANLVAENIKKDVTILGIVGTLEGGSGDLDELMQEEF